MGAGTSGSSTRTSPAGHDGLAPACYWPGRHSKCAHSRHTPRSSTGGVGSCWTWHGTRVLHPQPCCPGNGLCRSTRHRIGISTARLGAWIGAWYRSWRSDHRFCSSSRWTTTFGDCRGRYPGDCGNRLCHSDRRGITGPTASKETGHVTDKDSYRRCP